MKKYTLYAFLIGLVFRQIELIVLKFYSAPFDNLHPWIWLSYGIFAIITFLLSSLVLKFISKKNPFPIQYIISLLVTALVLVWISLSMNLNLTFIHRLKLFVTLDWFYILIVNLLILSLPGILIIYFIIKKALFFFPSNSVNKKYPVIPCLLIITFFVESILITFVIPSRREAGNNKNVILISVDALRKDHISLYGYPRKTTPNIDAFFQQDVRFDRCLATLPETGPSYTSLYTSSYPFEHRVYTNGLQFNPRATNLTTIADELREAGYYTSSHLSWSLPGSLSKLDFGLDELYQRGVKIGYNGGGDLRTLFANIRAWIKIKVIPPRNPRPIALETEVAVEWLDSHPQEPFYTHIYYHFPHFPYGDQGGSLVESLKEIREEEPYANPHPDTIKYISATRDLYDSDICYTDIQIGEIISALKRNGYLRNSLIVFTADHGEELGAREFQGAAYFGHSLWLYESSVNVPLIFHLPPSSHSSTVIGNPVSSIDIAPSILSFLGLSCPKSMKGKPLFTEDGELRGDLAEVQPWVPSFNITRNPKTPKNYIGIYQDGWTYIKDEILMEEELYNVQNDRYETDNLIAHYPARIDSFNQINSQLMETIVYTIFRDHPKANNVPQQVLENLRSLGYTK